jgi:hypothetical protein
VSGPESQFPTGYPANPFAEPNCEDIAKAYDMSVWSDGYWRGVKEMMRRQEEAGTRQKWRGELRSVDFIAGHERGLAEGRRTAEPAPARQRSEEAAEAQLQRDMGGAMALWSLRKNASLTRLGRLWLWFIAWTGGTVWATAAVLTGMIYTHGERMAERTFPGMLALGAILGVVAASTAWRVTRGVVETADDRAAKKRMRPFQEKTK